MISTPANPWAVWASTGWETLAGAGMPPGEQPGVLDNADDDDVVGMLYLAGQRPPRQGAWLLVTTVDGQPGADFDARVLPGSRENAGGRDVLVELVSNGAERELPSARVRVWAVVAGLLVPVATWDKHDLDSWPERIRPAVAFTMGVLTGLAEHGADIGTGHMISLAAAAGAPWAGIPLHAMLRAGIMQPGRR